MFGFSNNSSQQANNNLDLTGKNVLVTGGTTGIGAGVAATFAKRGANIYIAGRNVDAANEVLEKSKAEATAAGKYHGNQVFQFFQFDASLIKDSIRFAEEVENIFKTRGGLHFLVLSQGGIGNGKRRETAEGHEWWLAIHVFSRYIISAKLMPVLKQSGKGIVLNILSTGLWNAFDENNLELTGLSPNFKNVASRDGPINDIFTLEFNEKYPEVRFNHVFPGAVQTSLFTTNELGFFMGFLFGTATRLIGKTPEVWGEIAFNIAMTWYRPETESETHRFWGANGQKTVAKEYPHRPEVRAKVMETVERETGVKI